MKALQYSKFFQIAQSPQLGLSAKIILAAACGVMTLLPTASHALVRDGDQHQRGLQVISTFHIRSFSDNGQLLGEWQTRNRPTTSGNCVSWTETPGSERHMICGGVTHIRRVDQQVLQIQKQGPSLKTQ